MSLNEFINYAIINNNVNMRIKSDSKKNLFKRFKCI